MTSLESAITGAVASSLANVVVYPLDLVKTLIQTQTTAGGNYPTTEKDKDAQDSQSNNAVVDGKNIQYESDDDERYQNAFDAALKIVKTRGFGGLYQGLPASIMAGFIQSFSYFFWYSIVRKQYFQIKSLEGKSGRFSTPEELVLGILAAGVSQLFTNPISIISTRQQTTERGRSSGFISVARRIFQEQNDITGFWRGLKVSLVLTINPSITYAAYERLKDLFLSTSTDPTKLLDTASQLTAQQNFILGVLSKMLSTLITQPLIVSKALLQKTGSKFVSFQQVLNHIYKHEGFLALWRGVVPQLTKGIIVQGLLFMFKGELTKLLRRIFFYLQVVRQRRIPSKIAQ
ncbi:LAFE_0F05160g1_1 [Lachancea fermentati]|uniref:LAFE_0F05160g1_1 n=1 Tax=Lachancea fermentati TaxID=4955 RepID=A0A1G4MEP9_LACFM|nr:LAFE_0F05160g1_1 [Lachancea fermentati]